MDYAKHEASDELAVGFAQLRLTDLAACTVPELRAAASGLRAVRSGVDAASARVLVALADTKDGALSVAEILDDEGVSGRERRHRRAVAHGVGLAPPLFGDALDADNGASADAVRHKKRGVTFSVRADGMGVTNLVLSPAEHATVKGAVLQFAEERWRNSGDKESTPTCHCRSPRPAVWHALQAAARDQGCAFAGCDASVHHTEAHHCLPWKRGGRTDLGKLCLICKRHHRLIHHHEWTMSLDEGKVQCVDNAGRTVPTKDPDQPNRWTPR